MPVPKEPTLHKLNGKKYYIAKDVYDYKPTLFPGCQKSTRNMIMRKKLKQKDYSWYAIKDKEMKESHENYVRAKLLLTKEWVDEHVFNDSEDEETEDETEEEFDNTEDEETDD